MKLYNLINKLDNALAFVVFQNEYDDDNNVVSQEIIFKGRKEDIWDNTLGYSQVVEITTINGLIAFEVL